MTGPVGIIEGGIACVAGSEGFRSLDPHAEIRLSCPSEANTGPCGQIDVGASLMAVVLVAVLHSITNCISGVAAAATDTTTRRRFNSSRRPRENVVRRVKQARRSAIDARPHYVDRAWVAHSAESACALFHPGRRSARVGPADLWHRVTHGPQ